VIPIAPDEVFVYVDPKSGIRFKLSYLLDKQQPTFMRLFQEIEKGKKAMIPKAEKEIEAEGRGKKWDKGEKAIAINDRASNLYFTSIQNEPEKFRDFLNGWIDLFLVGWEGNHPRMSPFPKGGNPSRCFVSGDKFEMFSVIFENLNELTSLSESEAKK
jgi:hypothetical protein